MAIKTILFQSELQQQQTEAIASEAAIASNLSHKNVVATYSHDIRTVDAPLTSNELAVFKFYLVQVRSRHHPATRSIQPLRSFPGPAAKGQP